MPELGAPALFGASDDASIDRLVEAEVTGGAPYAYSAFACRCFPLLFFNGPVLELTPGYVQRDVFGFSWLEVDAIEGNERSNRELHPVGNLAWRTEVDLRDFVGCGGAGVLDFHLHVETAVT